MEKKTIGSFMAALRKAQGLTQRELAEKLNVSDKAVSRWERDESAPDLTLIPVIAEIFGITSDELLRGERSTGSTDPARAAERTEKQIRHLLKSTQTDYTIRCIITVCIALMGLIAAMIINCGFLRAIIGFLVGCALFVIAAACQTGFMIRFFHKLNCSDYPPDITAPCRRHIILGGQLCFGFLAVLFAACLPLVILVRDAHWGLNFASWMIYGSICATVIGIVWFAGCTAVNIRKGYWHKPDLKSPVNRLRLRWAKKGVLLLLLIVVLHIVSTSLLSQNYHLFLGGRKFDNWDDFRRYMEIPTDTDGTPLTFLTLEGTGDNTLFIYKNQSGDTVVFHKEDISHRIYATAEDEEAGNDPLVRYRHMNNNIASIRLNRGGLPVQVFTQLQMKILSIISACFHLFWSTMYILVLHKILRKYRSEKVGL